MECRHHDDVARRPRHLVAVFVTPHELVGGIALTDARFRRQFAGLGESSDLVPVLELLGVDGLPNLSRPHDAHIVVIAFGDFVLVVLVQHFAEHVSVTHRLTGDCETQIFRRFVLDIVDFADAKADASQSVRRLSYSKETCTRHGPGGDADRRGFHERPTRQLTLQNLSGAIVRHARLHCLKKPI